MFPVRRFYSVDSSSTSSPRVKKARYTPKYAEDSLPRKGEGDSGKFRSKVGGPLYKQTRVAAERKGGVASEVAARSNDKEGSVQEVGETEATAERSESFEERQQRRNAFRKAQEKYGRLVHSLLKKGEVSAAMEVLEQMKKRRLKPDVVVYNSIIAGYSRTRQVKQAFRLFSEVSGHRNAASVMCELYRETER